MNAIKRNIPNIITLANLTCGLIVHYLCWSRKLRNLHALCIFAGAFFDFFDGLAARLLKVSGELGKQLDSMADMVTFGVAPGMILFHLIYIKPLSYTYQQPASYSDSIFIQSLIAFLIPIFLCYPFGQL